MLDALTYWHTNIITKSRQRADSAERMEGRLSDSKKVGAASFWVTKRAIKVLLDNEATAPQICAYLVLARHTDKSGMFSTAGRKAVYMKVGLGQEAAQRAIDALCDMEMGEMHEQPVYLVHKALDTMSLPHGPGERSQIRHVLPDLDAPEEERVWIGANLVDGFRTFNQPLKRLKAMGDAPTRLLLFLYQFEAMEEFGGIHPWQTVRENYDMVLRGSGNGWFGHDIWTAESTGKTASHICMANSVGYVPPKNLSAAKIEAYKEEQWKKFWDALKKLDSAGFIYRMVSVMDRGEEDPDGQVLFELGIKSMNDYQPPKGEEGVGKPTVELAEMLGIKVADSLGRIRDKYAVVVPGGFGAYVVGIYRLRFRVSNPNNMGIKGAWARIHRGNAEALEWLQDLVTRVNKSWAKNYDPKCLLDFDWMRKNGGSEGESVGAGGDGDGDWFDDPTNQGEINEPPPF